MHQKFPGTSPRTWRNSRRIAAFAAATLTTFAISTATASATESRMHTPAADLTSVIEHCVAEAPLVGDDSPVVPVCFTRFDDAIAYATNGAVQLSNASQSRDVTDAEMANGDAGSSAPMSLTTTYVLSIDYRDSGYSGSTFTWTGSSPCGLYAASGMPSGWNDQVSSVHAFNGCAVTLYQNSGFGGSTYHIGVNGSASSLGGFNDLTSSEKWCYYSPCS